MTEIEIAAVGDWLVGTQFNLHCSLLHFDKQQKIKGLLAFCESWMIGWFEVDRVIS
ncbi:hypothetical protein ACFCP7_25295 [Paenibacillus elgii]